MVEIIRQIIHYGLHFALPGVIAIYFFPGNWGKVWLIMIITMVIDLDHLLSSPVFDANRCSINYHYLHTSYAAGFYFIMLLFRKTRIAGIGASLHLLTDLEDCLWIL